MDHLVILSKLEQEYLLRVIEAAVHMRDARQLFLWAQGQLQALLPHRVMVCMEFGAGDELLRLECLHGAVLDESVIEQVADPLGGLAIRAAHHCRSGLRLPCAMPAGEGAWEVMPQLRAALAATGLDNMLMHGSGPMRGGATVFVLFGMPVTPGPRHEYFLDLLLPHLHLALQRLGHGGSVPAPPSALRSLSARETEILGWVREGKSNYEVGRILGISGLTVKNHLQRIYRVLGVSNRAHALARCIALRLLDPAAVTLPPPP